MSSERIHVTLKCTKCDYSFSIIMVIRHISRLTRNTRDPKLYMIYNTSCNHNNTLHQNICTFLRHCINQFSVFNTKLNYNTGSRMHRYTSEIFTIILICIFSFFCYLIHPSTKVTFHLFNVYT